MTLQEIRQRWTLTSQRELLRDLAFIVLFVVLVNFTGIVEPSLNVDDYSQFGGHATGWHAHGRWLLGPFFEFLTLGAHAPPLLTGLGSLFLGVTGFIIAFILGLKPGIGRIIVGALFGSHPYFIDMMNFNTAVLAYPFALFLVAVGVLASNVRPNVLFIGLGALLVCCSLALYQASLGLLITLFVFSVGAITLHTMGYAYLRTRVRIMPLVAIAALGVLLYVGLTILLVESGSGRTELITSVTEVQAKILYVYYSLQETLLSDEILMPFFTKMVFWLLFVVMVHAAWSRARREGESVARGFLFVGSVLVVMGVVLLASYAIVVPVKAELPPRAMVGHAVFGAVVAAMVFSMGRRYHRVIGMGFGLFLIFQYSIIANEMMYKQRLLQEIDMNMALILGGRIANTSGFKEGVTYEIFYIGEREGPWRSQSSVLQSAFSRQWASRDILKLYGIQTTSPSDETTDWARAQSFEMGIWPSDNSIRLEEGRIVVRLD